MKNNFLSIYTSKPYNKPEVTDKKFVTKDEFIDLFLNIDWSLGTAGTYPNYPYWPMPKNQLFLFDIKNQRSISFDIIVCNDWSYEFKLYHGIYQLKDSIYHGNIEIMETSCYDEYEMVGYINDFFDRTYISIKKLKEESGVYYNYKKTFSI